MTDDEDKIQGMPEIGDYCLATKYSDGHFQDHFAFGYYSGKLGIKNPRYMLVDAEGKNMRGNGFRAISKIAPSIGHWFLKNEKANAIALEKSPVGEFGIWGMVGIIPVTEGDIK